MTAELLSQGKQKKKGDLTDDNKESRQWQIFEYLENLKS
jgi:uncharacterized protein YnzC (UPF0291/DUF896 family)